MDDGLVVVLEPRGLGDRLVDEASSVPSGAAPSATRCQVVGAVSEAEHLLARQRHPDRALQLPRRQDGQEHLVLRAEPQAERPADEGREDAQVVLGTPNTWQR